jgi:hypothetical protein
MSSFRNIHVAKSVISMISYPTTGTPAIIIITVDRMHKMIDHLAIFSAVSSGHSLKTSAMGSVAFGCIATDGGV